MSAPGPRTVALLALLLVISPTPAAGDDMSAADEQALRDAKIGADPRALLEFFRRRTPDETDARRAEALVRQLGDDEFERREQASAELLRRGPVVLPLLKKGCKDADPEVARRARHCLEVLEAETNAALTVAAVRLLAHRGPDGATEALLAWLPWAADEALEDETAEALALLADRPGMAAVLRKALADAQPARRAAAAFALGRSPDVDLRAAARRLLSDREPRVRFQAAQGLLAGKDKTAVPALVDLVAEGAPEIADRAELHLLRIAGDKPPALPEGPADNKAKRREAWVAWWGANARTIDLASLPATPPYLGLTLVPEMHAQKVWECGKDGKPLWEVADLQTPIDAQVLPGNRLLVAELNGGQVTERDKKGKVLWRHAVETPIACERLADGRTFIATNHKLFLVTRAGKEVFSYAPGGDFFIHSVQRLRNGHVVCVSMAGTVREIDTAGRVVCDVKLPINGGWSGVEGTPGGRYLAVNNNEGKIVEVDRKGTVCWEHHVPGACYASRLPNGNTLVVSNSAGVLEVDKKGAVVWKREMTTSLWRAHRR